MKNQWNLKMNRCQKTIKTKAKSTFKFKINVKIQWKVKLKETLNSMWYVNGK